MTKKFISILLVFGLTGFVALPTFAVEETTTDNQTQSTLEKRQEERKQEIKIILGSQDEKDIAGKCQAAQVLIKKTNDRIEKVYTSRTDKYAKLIAKLTAISSKLSNQDIDTAALDKEITQTQTLIDTFFVSFDAFKQAVADSKDIDCKAGPAGFKLALEDARTELQMVKTNAVDIKAQVKDKVKPELQNIRAILVAADNSIPSNQSGNDTQSQDPAVDPDSPVSSPAGGAE